jgi:hypothetical protein
LVYPPETYLLADLLDCTISLDEPSILKRANSPPNNFIIPPLAIEKTLFIPPPTLKKNPPGFIGSGVRVPELLVEVNALGVYDKM